MNVCVYFVRKSPRTPLNLKINHERKRGCPCHSSHLTGSLSTPNTPVRGKTKFLGLRRTPTRAALGGSTGAIRSSTESRRRSPHVRRASSGTTAARVGFRSRRGGGATCQGSGSSGLFLFSQASVRGKTKLFGFGRSPATTTTTSRSRGTAWCRASAGR